MVQPPAGFVGSHGLGIAIENEEKKQEKSSEKKEDCGCSIVHLS